MEERKGGRVEERVGGRMEGRGRMEVHLPVLRKLQNVAGIAAGVGFVLGLAIPVVAIFALNWHCPFGDGILQFGGFLALTAIGSAIVVGNLTALVSIGISKYRQIGSVRKPNLPGDESMASDSSKRRRS